MVKKLIFKHEFYIGLKDINSKKELKNKSILEFLENIACMHSDLVGLGMNDINFFSYSNNSFNPVYNNQKTYIGSGKASNDISSADAVILIKTGETFIYISVILTSLLLIGIVVTIVYFKIDEMKRKVGV